MYLLGVYVPLSAAEKLKEALFAAGAGNFGSYDCCCWETRGKGQFRPLSGSHPTLGEEGKVEQVEEIKIEMIVTADKKDAVTKVLKQVHPYEVPAYHFIPFEV